MEKKILDTKPKIADGFRIPENYFMQLSDKIMSEINHKPKTITFFENKKWVLAAAAIITILITTSLFIKYSTKQSNIEIETLENYIAYHSTVSDEDIINLISEDDLKELNFDLDISKSEIEAILNTNSNLDNYLID